VMLTSRSLADDSCSLTQLIRASEDRELWHMVTNVIIDGTAP